MTLLDEHAMWARKKTTRDILAFKEILVRFILLQSSHETSLRNCFDNQFHTV